ncbi:MAG: MFS transporter [Spirochaetia bacterium]
MTNRRIIVLAALGFFQHGLVMLFIGPILPDIMAAFGITESTTGLLLGLGAAGFTAGPLLGGILSDKIGVFKVIAAALFLESVFLALFGGSPVFWLLIAAYFLTLLFAAQMETTINVLPTMLKNVKVLSIMSFLHLCFSISAFLFPIFIGFYLSRTGSWKHIPWIVAAFAFGLFVFAVLTARRREAKVAPAESLHVKELISIVKEPPVFFGALTLALYVGAELGASAWVVHYLRSALGLSPVAASTGLSLLWVGIMTGRLLNGFFVRKFTSLQLTVSMGILGVIGGVLFILASGITGSYITLLILGFVMAGIYPNVMAEINGKYPKRVGVVTGFMAFGAGAGAMLFQWLIGFAAEFVGLKFALLIPAILMGLLCISYTAAVKSLPSAPPTRS